MAHAKRGSGLFWFALVLVMGLCIGGAWLITGGLGLFRPPQPMAVTLVLVIPDGFYGHIALYPGSAGTAAAGSVVRVEVDGTGKGILADPSIVNRGFVLQARRKGSGEPLPFLVEKGTVPPQGAVVLSSSGGMGEALSLDVVRDFEQGPSGDVPMQ